MPPILRLKLAKRRREPLPNNALKSMLDRVVFSKVNGPTAEFGLNRVRLVPPSRPDRQLELVHMDNILLAPGLSVTLLTRRDLGTLPRWALLTDRTRLRPFPLTASTTPHLLALKLLPAKVPDRISLWCITLSRQLPGFVHLPRRVIVVARGNPVLARRSVATQLLLRTTPSICPKCDPVTLVPLVGLYADGDGTTLVTTVVLDSARLPVLPPKHVPVVLRTLQEPWFRQTAPTQPYSILLPDLACVTPRVTTVLCVPFVQDAALFTQHCLVHRRATAELFRCAFPAIPPTNVWVTFPRLRFPLAQNAWPLDVITVPLTQLGSFL